jgi:hypothetical protein
MNADHIFGRPVVAVICEAPLLAEALGAALAGFAEVLVLPARRSDLAGLLDSVRPAGIVVEDDQDAAAAAAYARTSPAPVLHARLHESVLAVWGPEGWKNADGELSPELVRNTVLALMRSQGRAR